MNERILIDGVWYVREQEVIEADVTYYDGADFGNAEYDYQCMRIKKDDGTYYYADEFTLDITHKVNKDKASWEEDYWDNFIYIKNVILGKEIPEDFSEAELSFLISGLKQVCKEWRIKL